MRIALLGCTGQIGKGLARGLASDHALSLYARRPQVMRDRLTDWGLAARVFDLTDFPSGDFDLILNAIGDGVPGKIRAAGPILRETTERFDRQCLDHLDRNPACGYIFLSTGRIYGEQYEAAAGPDPRPLPAERLADAPYPMAKLEAECRHRTRGADRIADIRIFGYVSDEIDLNSDFLVAQMLHALVHETDFATTGRDFVRDYVGPQDLLALIARLIAADIPNGAYDLVSAGPATKFELLQALARRFGFRYTSDGAQQPCGAAPKTISRHTGAQAIGYVPQKTSLETVLGCAEMIRRRMSVQGMPPEDRRTAS